MVPVAPLNDVNGPPAPPGAKVFIGWVPASFPVLFFMKKTAAAASPNAASPPTTPPAMGPALEDFWEVETVATLGVPEEEALEEVALDVELPDEFMVGVFPEAEPVDCPDDEVVDFPDEEPVDFALEEVDEDAEFNAGALLQPVFPRPDVSDWACEVCLFASDTKTGIERKTKAQFGLT